MLALPLYFVFGGLTVGGFFNLQTASWVFITAAAIFACWLLTASWSLQSKWIIGLEEKAFSEAELTIFRKYVFYFIYPFQAKQYSSTFSFLQILCPIWIVMSLWQHEWALTVCFIALQFVAGNMALFLNQGNFLRHHEKRGNLTLELQERKELVESVERKILEARTKIRDS